MDRFSRAQFLRAAVGLTSAAVGVGLLRPEQARAATLETNRSYAAGTFMLVLDGARQGLVLGYAGGSPYADVVLDAAGANYYRRKHIGQPKYEAIELQLGPDLEPALARLISSSWVGEHRLSDGAIQGVDGAGVVISERQFFRALLVETTIPTLDVSAKQSGALTIKLAPEYTRDVAPSAGAKSSLPATQKQWLTSNFRFSIDGMDASRVSRIESFSVGQSAAGDELGIQREVTREPGAIDFPNLEVTFPQTSGQSWQAWFNDFVVGGNNQPSKTRKGTLALLGGDGKDLLQINLFGVGICKLGPARLEAGSDQIARMTAKLYCERMELEVL
jgi:hypothetical protein